MPGFNDLFNEKNTFSDSMSSKLPLDKNAQDEAIASLFMESIPFNDQEEDFYIKYINQSDDNSTKLGKVVVTIDNSQLTFPFVIKNNTISPFDIFMVNKTVFPAHISYLSKYLSNKGIGKAVEKSEGQDVPRIKDISNSAYSGSSISDVLSKMDSKKLGMFFKDNVKVANLYNKTSKGKLLNNLLTKIARSEASIDAYSILSAVAIPISSGTVKLGMLTTSGYIEDTLNLGAAEKIYPDEVSYIVKKALSTDEMAYTHTTRDSNELTPTRGELPAITIKGPLDSKGNLIEWDGTELNYKVVMVKNPKRLQMSEIKSNKQYIFFDPKSKTYTLPLFVNMKVLMNNQTVINGTDSFKRKVHVVIDPKLKHIYKQDSDPVVALIPPEWHIYHVPANKDMFLSETSKTSSYNIDSIFNLKEKIYVDGFPSEGKWLVKSSSKIEHGGNNFDTLKCATVLNYYIGDKFKDAISGKQKVFEYKPESVLKISSIQYNTNPLFLKLAALIPSDETTATLLQLNHLTPEVIKENTSFLPKLEEAIIYLSELLLTSRITDVYPESDIKKAIEYLIKVKKEIKTTSYKFQGK